MSPRRKKTASGTNSNWDHQIAEIMNNMATFVAAQIAAKNLWDLEKERYVLQSWKIFAVTILRISGVP